MKKYLLMTLSAMLLTTLVQAKDLPELSNAIERAVAAQVMPFANERVRQMCTEWPTCQEWVMNKVEQNPSFKVLDVEVERWLSKWDGYKAIWQYRFYAQTQENGQTKAYQFSSKGQGTSYAAPVLIKKFPGHPGKPTEHISAPSSSDARYFLCNSWPGYKQWYRNQDDSVIADVTSQYIYKVDAQGNALWKKRLYVKVVPPFVFASVYAVYFQAYQTQAGGDFTYQAPVKMSKFPTRSAF